MKNFVQPGDYITIPAPGPIASGQLVVANQIVGVAAHDASDGRPLTIAMTGVFDLPKTDKDVIDLGAELYAKDSYVTLVKEGPNVGVAVAASAQGKNHVAVRLRG